MIYPNNFETKLGFDKIRDLIKHYSLSELGKQKVDEMNFSTNFDTIERSLNLTNEFKHICLFADDFPVSFYFDVRRALNKIRVEGTYLTVDELFELKRSLEEIKAILNFFKSKRDDEYPHLRNLCSGVTMYVFVFDKINMVMNKNGQIKDNASQQLQQIRSELSQKQASVSKIMHSLLKKAMESGYIEDDASLTMRDGKMLIPISSTHKRKIKGVVYDESATGKTSFIEPLESIELNNEIRELEFAERREILKILIDFATEIRPYIDDLLVAYEFLAEIDFIRAKALFAISVNAVKPLFENKIQMDFRIAKHPILFLTLQRENRKIVPLDISIDENQRIIVISGPNAGGKSVCLKTAGLLQYMVQCGLLIPVSEYSHAGIFNDIFIDIGDEQSVENDLSTYSSHLINMKFFTENASEKTLILIDEFGTGTEPMLGAAIAEAILEELNAHKAKGIITTHYTNLKQFATENEGIVNGAMLFDSNLMQPLFVLETGKPGSSFAFEVARKIGLPEWILENATNKVGQDVIDFEKQLREMDEERKTIQIERQKIATLENKLEKQINHYNKELENTLAQRKNVLNLTNEQARKTLESLNKKIERAIFDIKHANADKEITKTIRKEVDEFKKHFTATQKEEEDRIENYIEELKKKEQERQNKKAVKQILANQNDESIKTGDKVRMTGQDQIGEVQMIKDKMCQVQFGNLQTFIETERLTKVTKEELKSIEKQQKAKNKQPANYEQKKQRDDFLFGLDVRGLRGDEALQKVMIYIDDAIVAGASELKILHGTGNGILRQLIRDYLKTVPVVKSVRDERIQLGGAGISIIELDY